MSRRITRAGQAAWQSSNRGRLSSFACLAQRVVLVMVLLGGVMGVFQLAVLSTVTGVAAQHMGILIVMTTQQ